jgi:hypothetical protein
MSYFGGGRPTDTGPTGGGDGGSSRDYDGGPQVDTRTHDEWYLDDQGFWRNRQVPGPKPTKGGRTIKGVNPYTGKTVGHVVYGVTKAAASSSSSASSSHKPGSRMSRADVIAAHYRADRYFDAVKNKWATRKVYVATAAERSAAARGQQRDTRGYFSVMHGRRVYSTGMDAASGRRFHVDARGRRIYDDTGKWPYPAQTRDTLGNQKKEYQSRLTSLKDQLKRARADQHVLRGNIVTRIRQVEALIRNVNAALARLTAREKLFTLHAPERPRWVGGVMVTLEMSTDGLSFQNPLPEVKTGATVYVRATVQVGNREWRPGLLAAPDMVRVRWTKPAGYVTLGPDGLYNDEYLSSNPLTIVRKFRAPSTGTTKGTFAARVGLYEFIQGTPPPGAHQEGIV